MKQLSTIIALFFIAIDAMSQTQQNFIERNGMTVNWSYSKDRIHFEMAAPTKGWVTIGFNTLSSISKAYLLMGNIVDGKAQIVEHYVISPGNYKPIDQLGPPAMVSDVTGTQTAYLTTLKFSLPVAAIDHYRKDLAKGSPYHLIMAFSMEDDFQHHSIMRTAINIIL